MKIRAEELKRIVNDLPDPESFRGGAIKFPFSHFRRSIHDLSDPTDIETAGVITFTLEPYGRDGNRWVEWVLDVVA